MTDQPRPLQHPSRIWNAIESVCNRVLSRFIPEKALRWCWGLLQLLVTLPLALLALQDLLGIVYVNTAVTDYICGEPIIACDSATVNPDNEGRLIKIQGKMTVPATSVQDPVLGLNIAAPCARRSFRMNPEGMAQLKSDLPVIKQLFTADDTLTTVDGHIGAYRIKHPEEAILERFISETAAATPDHITPGTPPEGITISDSLQIYTADGIHLGTVSNRIPSQPEPPLYIIGRQLNGCLDLSQPGTYETTPWVWEERERDTKLDFRSEEAPIIPIVYLALWVLLLMLLGTLRAIWWNLTRRADILRLPLWQAALLLGGGAAFLLTGAAIIVLNETGLLKLEHIMMPGLLFLIPGSGLLAYAVQLWRLKR